MPTNRKVARQESIVLREVPNGTPNRLAMVIPAIIIETASEPFPLSANLSATMEPTPKYAPCGSPEMKRAASNIQ